MKWHVELHIEKYQITRQGGWRVSPSYAPRGCRKRPLGPACAPGASLARFRWPALPRRADFPLGRLPRQADQSCSRNPPLWWKSNWDRNLSIRQGHNGPSQNCLCGCHSFRVCLCPVSAVHEHNLGPGASLAGFARCRLPRWAGVVLLGWRPPGWRVTRNYTPTGRARNFSRNETPRPPIVVVVFWFGFGWLCCSGWIVSSPVPAMAAQRVGKKTYYKKKSRLAAGPAPPVY